MKPLIVVTVFFFACALCAGQQDWWMREPIRWVQTNLRETDAALVPREVRRTRSPASTPTCC